MHQVLPSSKQMMQPSTASSGSLVLWDTSDLQCSQQKKKTHHPEDTDSAATRSLILSLLTTTRCSVKAPASVFSEPGVLHSIAT